MWLERHLVEKNLRNLSLNSPWTLKWIQKDTLKKISGLWSRLFRIDGPTFNGTNFHWVPIRCQTLWKLLGLHWGIEVHFWPWNTPESECGGAAVDRHNECLQVRRWQHRGQTVKFICAGWMFASLWYVTFNLSFHRAWVKCPSSCTPRRWIRTSTQVGKVLWVCFQVDSDLELPHGGLLQANQG